MKYIFSQVFRRMGLGLFNALALSGHMQWHRLWILKALGVCVGRNVQLNEALYFLKGGNISIGSNSNLGAFLRIWDYESVCFGENVMISNNVTIIAGTHRPDDFSYVPGAIVVGDGCWIGAGVTIIGPCRIGAGAIVGAGALVLHDIPDFTINVGVPAKIVKVRSKGQGNGNS